VTCEAARDDDAPNATAYAASSRRAALLCSTAAASAAAAAAAGRDSWAVLADVNKRVLNPHFLSHTASQDVASTMHQSLAAGLPLPALAASECPTVDTAPLLCFADVTSKVFFDVSIGGVGRCR
jgi:hypothetical protein